MWFLYVLGILLGYCVWCVGTYTLGVWLDDVMPDGKVKEAILSLIVFTWLLGVFLYVLVLRSYYLQRWLLIGCTESQFELQNGWHDGFPD